jgi:hypothetical protein
VKIFKGTPFSDGKPFACIGNDGAGYILVNLHEISTISVNDTPGNQYVTLRMKNGDEFDLLRLEDEWEVSSFLNYIIENLCSYSGFDKPEYEKENPNKII